MNYSELKTAIANHLHRTDLTSIIPDFVVYAESVINGNPEPSDGGLMGIRIQGQKTRTTESISTEYHALPTDLLTLEELRIKTSPVKTLKYLSPQSLSEKYPSESVGTPEFYTIHGGNFQFAPIPDTTYTLEVSYTQKYSALSADDDTNALLTTHPNIYIYSACIAGASYIEADPSKFISLYNTLAKTINNAEEMTQYAGNLITRTRTATP